jgi:hypothetical protein
VPVLTLVSLPTLLCGAVTVVIVRPFPNFEPLLLRSLGVSVVVVRSSLLLSLSSLRSLGVTVVVVCLVPILEPLSATFSLGVTVVIVRPSLP